jgi:hypothetical protein
MRDAQKEGTFLSQYGDQYKPSEVIRNNVYTSPQNRGQSLEPMQNRPENYTDVHDLLKYNAVEVYFP